MPRTLTVRLLRCTSQSASGVLAAAAYGREARGNVFVPLASGGRHERVIEVFLPHGALDEARCAYESTE